MRLGMVANTISVTLFGIIWQPWQVGEKKSSVELEWCWEEWYFKECYACYWISSKKNMNLDIFLIKTIKIQHKYIQHPFFTSHQIFNLPNLSLFSNLNNVFLCRFQAFLPPLGCILAFAVFPTANSLAATAAPTQMATAQGLISGSRTLAEGVSPVLFGGGGRFFFGGGDGTWKKWKKWNKHQFAVFSFWPFWCCVIMWKGPAETFENGCHGFIDVSSWRHAWFQHV